MKFNKAMVYTAVNADELSAGDKVIVADNMADLKILVEADAKPTIIELIQDETNTNRFTCQCYGSKKTYEIIQAEYENAKEKWGDRYASLHEGFAVLLEEVEETRREYKAMKFCVQSLWNEIMNGDSPQESQKHILSAARKLAMEACQVAAVCKKMLDGVVR